MGSMAIRVTWAISFAVLADLILFGFAPGCGITLFALLLGGVLAFSYRGRMRNAWPWNVLWVLLALAATVEGSYIGLALLVLLGWAVLALCLLPEEKWLLTALGRGISGGVRSLTVAPSDLRRYSVLVERRYLNRWQPAWVFALPVILVIGFSILIVPANLVLARWTENAFQTLYSWSPELTLSRVLFWLAAALLVYGALRFRLGRRRDAPKPKEAGHPADVSPAGHALKACVYSLVGLNLLYLAANVADLLYLWLSFDLPEGMTYAQFAHEGSYRLIIAVMLAAITLTAFFPANSIQLANRVTRKLAFLFVFQNLLVLAGAARRLYLYVSVYDLSRFRVATMLWMMLVAIGFLLIFIRIRKHLPIMFLFRTNAVTCVLMLSAVAFLNVDGFIANWNVSQYETGVRDWLDVNYLAELEAPALPALAHAANLARSKKNAKLAERAERALVRCLDEERTTLISWQSWTWRRANAVSEAESVLQRAGLTE